MKTYTWTTVCVRCGQSAGHPSLLVSGPAWEHIGGDDNFDHYAEPCEDRVVEHPENQLTDTTTNGVSL